MANNARLLFQKIIDKGAEAEVGRMVADRELESDILDYKGGDKIDSKRIKELWSKSLSGFANAGGGVLIWGVDCRKVPVGDLMLDQPTSVPALCPNVTAFSQSLNDLVLSATADVITGVQVVPVPVSGGPSGYVVCFVPEGINRPYKSLVLKEYFIRITDRFAEVSHSLLRSLFYAKLMPKFSVEIHTSPVASNTVHSQIVYFTVELKNVGKATARDALIKIQVEPEMMYELSASDSWVALPNNTAAGGRIMELELNGTRSLHPGYAQKLCSFVWEGNIHAPRFSRPFEICVHSFVNDGEAQRFSATVTGHQATSGSRDLDVKEHEPLNCIV